MIRHLPVVPLTLLAVVLAESWRPPENGVKKLKLRSLNEQYSEVIKTPLLCVPINEPACQTSLYNLTFIPNEWGQATQADAAAQIKRFKWILRSQCSPLLPIFMCIFFFPVCSENPTKFPYTEMVVVSRPPCAEMCQNIHDECRSWLHRNGFDWPTAFSCDKLPPKDGEQECFYPVSNVQALDASRQALTNMAKTGVVPVIGSSQVFSGEKPVKLVYNDHGGDFKYMEHEISIEEPESNLALLIAISIFIVLLILLSISIAFVRCYFQVCAGSGCSHDVNRAIRKSPSRTRRRFFSCFGTTPKSSSGGKPNTNGITDQSGASDKSRLKRGRTPVELEEQSKSISISDVEESALLPKNHHSSLGNNRKTYSKFADHNVRTLPTRHRPGRARGNEMSLSYCEDDSSVGQWKQSPDELITRKGFNDARINMASSASMNFDKDCEIAPSASGGGKFKEVRFQQQQLLSKSQPDLEAKIEPVWLERKGTKQPEVSRTAGMMRRSQTHSIGVGTSPSLSDRKSIYSSGQDGCVKVSVGDKRQLPSNASSASKLTPAGTGPSAGHRSRTRIVASSLMSSPEKGQNDDATAAKPQKRSLTPTKYSITLFLDEAQRLTRETTPNVAVKTPISNPKEESNKTNFQKLSAMKPLPITPLIITPMTKSEHSKNPNERQPNATRELFYV